MHLIEKFCEFIGNIVAMIVYSGVVYAMVTIPIMLGLWIIVCIFEWRFYPLW